VANKVLPLIPATPVDTMVIFDSGSGLTTVPDSNFLSKSSSMTVTLLAVITTDGSAHSFTHSGIFQGLPSHVLPSFQDILIFLPDYLSQCQIAIVDSTSMRIFNKTILTDNAIDNFRSKLVTDSVLTAPVKDKIYSVSITKFTSAFVIMHASVSSTLLPSSSFVPEYVVRNYETAHFST